MRSLRTLSSFTAVATFALSIAAGCNGLTGAEGIELEEDDLGNEAVAPAPLECVYPTAGFSNMPGGVVPDRTWQGFVNDSAEPAEVALSDYLDCDGSKGIHGLLVDVSATWCGSCQAEAQGLNGELATQWEALGIRVLTLMIEDGQSKPATPETALAWKNKFNLKTSTVAADPQFALQGLAPGGGVGLPFLIVIDPRTMTLVSTSQGYLENENDLIELALKNQPE